MRVSPVASLALIAAAACGSPTDVGLLTGPGVGDEIRTERQLAWIRFYRDPMHVAIPNVVTRGVDFEVAVRTFGGGCIGQGDTEVAVTGRTAEVRPFDLFVTQLPQNAACTMELRYYLHRATVRFNESGVAKVRIRGRAHPGNDVVVIEEAVVVR